MSTINPSAKLIGLIALTMTIAFIHHPFLNLIVFALCTVVIVLSLCKEKRSLSLFFGPMLPIVLLAVAMFFTGYRFTTAGSTVVNLEALHVQGIMRTLDYRVWNGLIFASRVLVYAGLGLLFALTTDRIRMIRSFEKQLHVPQVFAYGLLSAWGLMPKMLHEYRKTRLAFQARGIRVLPFSPKLLVTLLVKTTRWSEELSVAMESKGFSETEKRTAYQPERMRRRDWAFLVGCVVVIPVVCFLLFAK